MVLAFCQKLTYSLGILSVVCPSKCQGKTTGLVIRPLAALRPLQVEDAWKATEFTVLTHRDAKDVFILGGTDDIQARR